MTDPVLEIEDLRAGYGQTQVLNGISLAIPRGQRFAVLGRNGVGKTTLLATIMGLTRMRGGSVRFEGTAIGHLAAHRRARLGLGLVPQTRDIFGSLSVEENLLAGLRGDATLEEAYALFPRLKERRRNGGTQLSGGEQQMLAIARTLMGRPKLLLLDEPLEGLAPVICDQLMEVFDQLAGSGACTVVLVEQHTELALAFADRLVILNQGTVVFEGTARAVASDRRILERHVGVGLVS